MARCFVTRDLPGTALQRLRDQHDVEIWSRRMPPSPSELRDRAAGVEGLLCLLTDRVDADLIAACPRLRVISNYAVGWDNVDVAAAEQRGIPVGHTPGVLTEATADFAFALLLGAARRVVAGDGAVRGGEWLTWEPGFLLGGDVHGATLGVVGAGRIGRAVMRRAEGFGMNVIASSRSGGRPLDEVLAASDFVSLHVPLTEATRGLIGERELRLMRADSILVNTARGGVVDQRALERALREGWIGGAALDVTEPEPLPPGHSLLGAPNLLVTPHIASASRQARAAMADLAVDNLLAGLAGRALPHRVDVASE